MWEFPNIDPVALQLGPLAIRWYALAYIAGIVLGVQYMAWLLKKQAEPILTRRQLDDLMFWAVIGIILGGRLVYVLFYNLPYYLDHPEDIYKVWQGGMAFHGGMMGVMASFYLFCRKHKIAFLPVIDLTSAAAPIGLLFGRLANFINGELFGRVTDSSLGMVFPRGGELPRHPSQLYEAGLEGVALFLILFIAIRRFGALHKAGLIGGMFLAGYGASRFTVEFFREPDAQLGLLSLGLSMGQWLSLPMLLIGLVIMWRSHVKAKHESE